MPDGQYEWEKERSRDEGLNRRPSEPSSYNGVTYPYDARACAALANPVAVGAFFNFLNANDEGDYVSDL